MTDLFTDKHHIGCNQEEKLVKVKTINLSTGDAILECGCEISLYIDHMITII